MVSIKECPSHALFTWCKTMEAVSLPGTVENAQQHQLLADLVSQRKASIEASRRHGAMFNGQFFRQLLPYMEEFKVLSKRKVDSLMGKPEHVVERSLSTRELLELAIKWGITESPAAFWRDHKTKQQLVQRLREAKAELEYVPPEQEEGMIEVGEG